MKIQYSSFILLVGIITCLIIYFLSFTSWVNPANEQYLRILLVVLFITGTAFAVVREARELTLFSKTTTPFFALLFLTLSFLLVSTIFHIEVGNYLTGIFIGAAFLFFIFNKKFYKLNTIYYFLFLYALLMTIGTIGTPRGFRFPDTALSFILLPLAYSCFELPKETLRRVARVFFRGMIVYMTISLIYWWYNFLFLDVNFFEWITSKLFIDGSSMQGWHVQTRIAGGTTYSAFYFVTSWANYFHPSYISLVLFFGLIVGFYLYYKKDDFQLVKKREIALYIVLCFFVVALMESRIGLVGLFFILISTGLYYSKLKTSHFKIIVSFCFISACVMMFLFNDSFDQFIDDRIRKIDYTLAINYIKDHFWWGVGFDEQKSALEQQELIMKGILPSANNIKTYTHNQFLGNMLQFGIWGLLVLLAMLFAIIRYAVKSRNYLLQMFLFIIILFMMIEEPLYGQKGFTIFSVFLTFFTAVRESGETRKVIIDFSKNRAQKS